MNEHNESKRDRPFDDGSKPMLALAADSIKAISWTMKRLIISVRVRLCQNSVSKAIESINHGITTTNPKIKPA